MGLCLEANVHTCLRHRHILVVVVPGEADLCLCVFYARSSGPSRLFKMLQAHQQNITGVGGLEEGRLELGSYFARPPSGPGGCDPPLVLLPGKRSSSPPEYEHGGPDGAPPLLLTLCPPSLRHTSRPPSISASSPPRVGVCLASVPVVV